jgi:hypothetical protein
MGKRRRLHRALDHGIVDPVELECKEQQMRRGVRQPLGDVAVEFRDRGIDAVAGMNQAGVGTKSAREIVDRLVTFHRGGEPRTAALACGLVGKLALVVRLKRDAFGINLLEIARDLRRVDAGIEIAKVPFR